MFNYRRTLKIICTTSLLFISGSSLATAQDGSNQAQQQQSINHQDDQSQLKDLGEFIEQILKERNQRSSSPVNYATTESSTVNDPSSQFVDQTNSNENLETIFENSNESELQQPATLVNFAPSGENISDANPTNTLPSILNLTAQLTPTSKKLTHGLTWRIFSQLPNLTGDFELIEISKQAAPQFQLIPGKYIVSATYGFATTVSEIFVSQRNQQHTIVLDAGGLKLEATVEQNESLPNGKVLFDIYSMDYNDQGERRVIAKNIPQGQIISLNADTYHIVSRYGKANAVVSADIQILSGKLIEAKMLHSAAEITLKLVNEPEGDALIGTNWTIRSEKGEIIASGNGAYPSHILATGKI